MFSQVMQFNFYTLGTAFHTIPLTAECCGHSATLASNSQNIYIYYSKKNCILELPTPSYIPISPEEWTYVPKEKQYYRYTCGFCLFLFHKIFT